ncbi:DUF1003 domain-containing protein [Sphingomonas sp. BK235]|uniref:DUF1003 domain-containing protein n=1 Tax=Sphingomonas sp. BK235 TaxID=2512131 RepID=UPI00104C28C2|nr:DUF1003 domain-containing protein [Sphingomonas sp. BK235]TCP36853.1 putative membrane protein [Sphingomonas sp. BK235]
MASNPLHAFAARLIGKAPAALDAEERRVLAKIAEKRPVARDAGDVADETATLGDRLADRVAAVGGSWGFILGFALLLLGWMLLNSGLLPPGRAFDPYPYIFLNLMLSTLAAVQAPVIMMSQNRQATKDRLAARLDYEVNLRTELEILRLHDIIELAVAARIEELIRRQRPEAA